MNMNIKELNEKLEIILQETNTRTNAFEPAPPTTKEEYKVLKAISDYLLEKINLVNKKRLKQKKLEHIHKVLLRLIFTKMIHLLQQWDCYQKTGCLYY